MQTSEHSKTRLDWPGIRETIDLATLATRLLGPAPGRRGERGRKLWWPCPFHEDANPSFCVTPGKPWWHCFGCGQSGDAMALVRRLNPSMSFPEAVAILTGGAVPARKTATKPAATPAPKPPPETSGLPEADALALVEAAAARLWSPEGAEALAHLTGPRCLSPETIRAARLGWTSGASIPTRDGDRSYRALGWVIPWFNGGRLALVKIRQPDGRRPKYAEAFRDPARLVCYPGPEVIHVGRPLVIVEGDFDALLLGQELAGVASVVTLGSASVRHGPETHLPMLGAPRWYIATDNDPAGEKSADSWPARARRARPPDPYKDWTEARQAGVQNNHGPLGLSFAYKDWTEARQAGVNLARWWRDILAGIDDPPLYTWEELAALRWGGAGADEENIIIDRPDRGRLMRALEAGRAESDRRT